MPKMDPQCYKKTHFHKLHLECNMLYSQILLSVASHVGLVWTKILKIYCQNAESVKSAQLTHQSQPY